MGIFKKRRPVASVIRPEDHEARRLKELEERRVVCHSLQRLELRDVTTFIDMLVAAARQQFIDEGEVQVIKIRFPDKMQDAVTSDAFKRSLYPMIRRAIPEAVGDCINIYWDEPSGYSLELLFPKVIQYRGLRFYQSHEATYAN